MATREDDGSFLQRWSQRKAEARQSEDAPDPPAPAPVEPAAPAPEIGPDQLPDLDSLGPGSDFRAFMQEGVPKELRRVALRKLWRSNPVLANLDGLVDYGEDFTDAGTVVANLQSAYQVGRGYLKAAAGDDKSAAESADADQGAAPVEPPAVADAGAPPTRVAQESRPVAAEVSPVAPADSSGTEAISAEPTRPAPRPLPKRG